MMNLIKGALQQELDKFFQTIEGTDVALSKVTKSAFCTARKLISSQAFVELNQVALKSVYDQATLKQWHGFRLCAVDGTKLRIPDIPTLRDHFGVQTNGVANQACPMAIASASYDVLNDLILDARIAPLDQDERSLAAEHLALSHDNDLILYDRGYPAFWLLALHQQMNRQYCMRVPRTFCAEVTAFIDSGAYDQCVQLAPGFEARKLCQVHGVSDSPLQVRLVRVILDNGDIEVLMTSLLDATRFPVDCFKALYHLRWGIEEIYKRLKSRLEIENFSGKSVLSVEQDFHAKILTQNLTALTATIANAQVQARTAHRCHTYKINLTEALSKMKYSVVLLLTRVSIRSILTALIRVIAACIEPIRPDRKYPRKSRPSRRNRFNYCYKRPV